MDLTERDHREYYNGFANSTLWPLFHYRLDLAAFSRRTYAGYQRVNSLFASRLAPLLRPDDRVWVHDYHLIPFGEQLRHMGFGHRLGFFLHTPWPAPEILVALPHHADLVRALCAYDLVGFHTASDLNAFVGYIRGEARGTATAAPADPGPAYTIEAFGRGLRAEVFPIGIDPGELATLADSAAAERQTTRLKESLGGRDLIIGVDRLDYSKGLPQRFEAVQTLLDAWPANRGRVSFMQIAPPSRSDVAEYAAIRRELETVSGHINGRFAEFDWAPIRYLNKSFSRRTLAGFFRISRVALVTPLRDGMNLVAKEYVASQDPDDPGVLVLSRFAGAAAELDAALIVNPYDIEGVADSLQQALGMGLDERRERYQAMIAVLRRNDVHQWRERFIKALQ
jgi:trehalose 6-phosphate synthase